MAIDTLKQEEGAVEEGEGVGDVDTTRDIISENELQLFCDSLSNTLQNTASFQYTLDYFDPSIGILYSKDHPTCLNFCVALLREILCNLKPNHELWDKIQYAAFLLNLATRNIDFNILYEIFHQVETNVNTNHWSWREAQVKAYVTERIAEKIIVKDDVCSLPDVNDIKRDTDFDDYNFNSITINGVNKDLPFEDNFNSDIDNLGLSDDDDMADADFVVDAKDERLIEAEEGFDEQEMNDRKADVKKIVKEEKPKKRRKIPNKKTEEESNPAKVKRKPGRPRTKEKKPPRIIGPIKTGRKRRDWYGDKTVPEEKAKLLCNLCEFRALSGKGLERHAFEIHETNRLCTQCGHLSETFDDYLEHDQIHPLKCEVCEANILGSRRMKSHMKMHETKNEDKPELDRTTCSVCGQLVRICSLSAHMKQMHSTEVFECDVCGKTANSKSRITTHRKKHFMKPIECPECGTFVKDLQLHFNWKCGNKKKEKLPCNLCTKTFVSKAGLDRHIKQIHQKIMDFQCDSCDYKTYTNYNLKIHISKMHTKEELQKLCQICNQKTGNMDYHMRIYHIAEYVKSQANKQEQLMSPERQTITQDKKQNMQAPMSETATLFHTQLSNIDKHEDPHSLDAPT
eukprot:TRINITY_DN2504_c2_g1_i5.p1 TRINITY_DN2504_c2_g1~~TRINITY_DN2504_c2_g1_i5.p1  ORF type:complete len:626 (+),score=101.23 TRINITY_DN2504_c2_g1_i5:81-1958(+)